MAEDVQTPELVELQDTLSKTSTEIVNELPSESTPKSESDVTPDVKAAEDTGGLTESQKKKFT